MRKLVRERTRQRDQRVDPHARVSAKTYEYHRSEDAARVDQRYGENEPLDPADHCGRDE